MQRDASAKIIIRTSCIEVVATIAPLPKHLLEIQPISVTITDFNVNKETNSDTNRINEAFMQMILQNLVLLSRAFCFTADIRLLFTR